MIVTEINVDTETDFSSNHIIYVEPLTLSSQIDFFLKSESEPGTSKPMLISNEKIDIIDSKGGNLFLYLYQMYGTCLLGKF